MPKDGDLGRVGSKNKQDPITIFNKLSPLGKLLVCLGIKDAPIPEGATRRGYDGYSMPLPVFTKKQIDKLIYESRANNAIAIAVRYGGIDGDHHKSWVIDQMVKALADSDYDEIVKSACEGEDGPETYIWETGIAP